MTELSNFEAKLKSGSNSEIIDLIPDHEFNLNPIDDQCNNILMMMTSPLELIEILFKKAQISVKINDTNFKGNTVFHILSKYPRLDVLKFLFSKNPNPNIKNNKGNIPLVIAINQFSDDSTIFELLSLTQIDLDLTDNNGLTSLMLAIEAMREELNN